MKMNTSFGRLIAIAQIRSFFLQKLLSGSCREMGLQVLFFMPTSMIPSGTSDAGEYVKVSSRDSTRTVTALEKIGLE